MFSEGWGNTQREMYSYDENGNRIEFLRQGWDGEAWYDLRRWLYTVDERGNAIQTLGEEWEDSVWVNSSFRTSTYDEFGRGTDIVDRNWDGSAWVNDYRIQYTLDNKGNRLERVSYEWEDGQWTNSWRTVFFYAPGVGIDPVQPEVPWEIRLLQNAPNPFQSTTTIRYTLSKGAEVRLIVHDALGRLVEERGLGHRRPGLHSVDFDASRLPSGVYLYRLSAGPSVATRRMVVLR
jgi:hypothetical protein